MKRAYPSHGTRHRPSPARRRYRDLRHEDDSVADLHRADRDQMEYEQWISETTTFPCTCCYPEPWIYWHDRLRLALTSGEWNLVVLRSRVEPKVWSRLESQVVDHAGGHDEKAVEQGRAVPSAEGLAEELYDFFSQLRNRDMDVREVLGPSAAEMVVLNEFRRRWLVCSGSERLSNAIDHALSMVLLMERFWLRDLSVWQVPEVCGEAELRDLLRYLFVNYPVPDWLLGPFWTSWHELPPWKWVMWLVVLGAGGSLPRAGRVLGWWVNTPLTQELLTCREEVSPSQACLISEVLRRGGTRALAVALIENPAFDIDPTAVDGSVPASEWRVSDQGAMREFWGQTVDWLIRKQDELPETALPGILAWAMHEYTEQRARHQAFTWKGRTPEAAIRAAAHHANSCPDAALLRARWAAQGWDWTWTDEGGAAWTIQELTVGRQLREEGQAMHHCVGGYIRVARDGHQAIFSMRKNGIRVITIAVRLPARVIEQAYGVCNRPASREEKDVVKRWQDEVLKQPR